MSGFIYIMSNPSFSDGRIKIGKSKSDPNAFRKDELYSTGVPEPFKLEYVAFVEEHDAIESIVHRTLSAERPNKNREFFTCSIPHAILTIQQNSQLKFEEIFYESPEKIEEERRKQIEDANRRKHLEEVQKQKNEKLQQEEKIKHQQRAEIDRQRREQTKNEFFEVLKLLIKASLIFGFFLGSLFFAEKIENKDNSGFVLAIVVIAFAIFGYFMLKITNDKKSK